MKKVLLKIDWYTKCMLTMIVILLSAMLIKPVFITQRAVAETSLDRSTAKFTPPEGFEKLEDTSHSLEYARVRAIYVEGSDKEAEADAEEWNYLCDDPKLLKGVLDKNEYYQEHPCGRAYLELLLQKARNTERVRANPLYVIDKKGNRYFVYEFTEKRFAPETNK